MSAKQSVVLAEQPVEPFLARMAVNLDTLEEQVKGFTIKSDEDATALGALGSQAVANMKALEAQRKEFVKPLNDHVDLINGRFKPVVTRCQAIGQMVSRAVSGWLTYKNEQARLENQRATDAAYRSQHKAIQEYARAASKAEDAKKPIPAPAEQVQALLYSAPNIPSDATDAERGAFRIDHEAAVKYAQKARTQAMVAEAPAPVAKSKVEVAMAPVAAEPVKSIGTFSGREDTVLKIIDTASIPMKYMIDEPAALANDKQQVKLTKASRIILFTLDAGAILREFTAGRQVPGIQVEKKLGGSL